MGVMDSWAVVLTVVGAVGSALGFAGAWLQERRSGAAQLSSIQRKLDLVVEHLGLTDATPERLEVVRHLTEGQTVAAVRAYRRHTGASLLEAKQAVDRIATERELPR